MYPSLSFAPTMLLLADRLRLSEFLAGSTLLALGNAFGDLTFAGRTDHRDTALAFNEMLGSALFVTAAVGGLVLVLRPLHELPANVLWQTGGYAVAVLYVAAIAWDEVLSVPEACGCAAVYAVYVGGLVAAHLWYVRRLREMLVAPTTGAADTEEGRMLRE